MLRIHKSQIAFFLALVLFASPIVAQQKRAPAPKKPAPAPVAEPAPTFDSLLSDDSYRIYFEIRNVGNVVRLPAVTEMADPLIKLAGPPNEFKTILNWVTEQADALADSRLFVATAPGKPNLPSALVAVEFSSSEEARKFQSALRKFLPVLMPTPTPSPSPSSNTSLTTAPQIAPANTVVITPPAPNYEVKQFGSLVLLTASPVSLRDLKPRGSKLLAENANFSAIHNRFAAEPLFLYVNVESFIKEQLDKEKKWHEEEKRQAEVIEAAAAASPEVASANRPEDPMPMQPHHDGPEGEDPEDGPPPPMLTPEVAPALDAPATSGTPDSPPVDLTGPLMMALWGGFEPKWPDAVGAALVLDDATYTLRVLTIRNEDSKAVVLPFLPHINPGPAITPAAANIFPADTQLFVTLSLDYRETYASLTKSLERSDQFIRVTKDKIEGTTTPASPTSPMEAYEKQLGIKIKDDLLPLLGNEIALALPKPPAKVEDAPEENRAPESGPKLTKQNPAQVMPVVAIAIKDREGVKRLIGRMMESLGFKGANLLAQSEKREDTEITSFANTVAYAFIGDFLVVSGDVTVARRIVDDYLNRRTLASDPHFRNATDWQPRQIQGQVYMAPSLIDMYYPLGTNTAVNDQFRETLSRMNPVIDPLTYVLTNDGIGPLHELHVPRNLLTFAIAGMANADGERSLLTNESIAKSMMRTVAAAQATFQASKGAGRFGTLDELISEGLVEKDLMERYGYRIELSALANKFEATATPLEYGKTGRMSFFIDESGVIRGGDHAGGAATLADKPIEQMVP